MVGLLYDLPSSSLFLCFFPLLPLLPPLRLMFRPTLIRLLILLSFPLCSDLEPLSSHLRDAGSEPKSSPCPGGEAGTSNHPVLGGACNPYVAFAVAAFLTPSRLVPIVWDKRSTSSQWSPMVFICVLPCSCAPFSCSRSRWGTI
jgi:hypothetical protein